jgi:DNA-binding MarR family transcriptional regulator
MLLFDLMSEPIEARIVDALGRLGMALRQEAWQACEAAGLTPTQASILGAVLQAARRAPTATQVARQLGVTLQTASVAIHALVAKGLLQRVADRDDGRAIRLHLTPAGSSLARSMRSWPEALRPSIDALGAGPQAALLAALVRMLHDLDRDGRLSTPGMCISCRHFRPHVTWEQDAPHRCDFHGAQLGDRHFRLACPEHEPAPDDSIAAHWRQHMRTWHDEAGRPIDGMAADP